MDDSASMMPPQPAQTAPSANPAPQAPEGSAAPSPEGEDKVTLTGWTVRVEVLVTGEGATQAEAVPDATNRLEAFLDQVRADPHVRLVKLGDPAFGTRKVGPQP